MHTIAQGTVHRVQLMTLELEVTQVGERTVNIEEIVTPAGGGTVEAELKAPTVIGISLHYSF